MAQCSRLWIQYCRDMYNCTYTVYILYNTNNVHFCIFYLKKKILKITVCTLQDSKYYRVEKIHTFFWETNQIYFHPHLLKLILRNMSCIFSSGARPPPLVPPLSPPGALFPFWCMRPNLCRSQCDIGTAFSTLSVLLTCLLFQDSLKCLQG